MAAKVALSPGSQSQKVDSIFAKPLINQTLATPAKVFQFVQKDLALVSQSGATNLVMDLKVSRDSKVPSPAMDFQVRVELSIPDEHGDCRLPKTLPLIKELKMATDITNRKDTPS
ncbi:hypothetical protein GIB67_020564 [Kingdonia uniflora]|uniref:Uncharacterized protein n=1 Tax=Kingdonia uniflora TaxID=39325 RepID=A0A7J7NLX4_9MAGN|nr:hypothetical protein GIB67_020564 [Kingdonia uniflora]